jgi:hypothetical protein
MVINIWINILFKTTLLESVCQLQQGYLVAMPQYSLLCGLCQPAEADDMMSSTVKLSYNDF